MSERLTETIERLQDASTRASGYPVGSTLMISGPNVKGFVVTSITIPDLLFAAQELRRLRALADTVSRQRNIIVAAAAIICPEALKAEAS